MAKKKFYAIKSGYSTGVFETWDECQKYTAGYPNADYKSFLTREEAEAYLSGEDSFYDNEIAPRLENNQVVIFVDGSYDNNLKIYGSGVYIITKEGNSIELSNKGNNKNLIDYRNVIGEIRAVYMALDWCIANGVQNVAIYHDYEGLSKWVTGEWRANNYVTSNYRQMVLEKQGVLNIEFIKVKGHSNNKYNDLADNLAKGAINNKILSDANGNVGYVVNNIHLNDLENLLNLIQQLHEGVNVIKNHKPFGVEFKVNLNKENVTVSLFNNTKLVVRGKFNNLFQVFTSNLVENIDVGDFIKVLKNAYNININVQETEDKVMRVLSTHKHKVPQTYRIILEQTIIDYENSAYQDVEFSKYTYNACRVLDGSIKIILNEAGIPLSQSKTFNMFEYNGNAYSLKSEFMNVTNEQKMALEDMYNYYHKQRHTLAHFGILISSEIDNTRLINTKEEANEIILDILKLVHKYI